MKKFVAFPVIILAIFFLNIDLFGQSGQDSTYNSLVKGSWSLQFRISSNFTLSSFLGSNISAKTHLAPKHAIRFGISLYGYERDTDKKSSTQNDVHESSSESQQEDRITTEISTQYLFYSRPDKRINIFYGLGPFINYSSRNFERQHGPNLIDTLDAQYSTMISDESWSMGLLFSIGIEVFFTRYLSLTGEYGTSLYYQKTNRDDKTDVLYHTGETANYQDNYDITNYYLHDNAVKFGVSVYF
ncbi:MAG: hypothetical protein JXL67_07715 [Calditrichaeota bacterium]|nr:hypothetical protein [Calditrichota bacterium]